MLTEHAPEYVTISVVPGGIFFDTFFPPPPPLGNPSANLRPVLGRKGRRCLSLPGARAVPSLTLAVGPSWFHRQDSPTGGEANTNLYFYEFYNRHHLLGRAIVYTYATLPRRSRYVLDGRCQIDGNGVEKAIKPFATGRSYVVYDIRA